MRESGSGISVMLSWYVPGSMVKSTNHVRTTVHRHKIRSGHHQNTRPERDRYTSFLGLCFIAYLQKQTLTKQDLQVGTRVKGCDPTFLLLNGVFVCLSINSKQPENCGCLEIESCVRMSPYDM
jgi:hypothetical protein